MKSILDIIAVIHEPPHPPAFGERPLPRGRGRGKRGGTNFVGTAY